MTQRADLRNQVDEMLDRSLRDLIESHPTPLILLADDGYILERNSASNSWALNWPEALPLTQIHGGLIAGEAIPGYSTVIDGHEAFLEIVIQHTSNRYDTPMRVTLCRLALDAVARQRASAQHMRALGELSSGWAHDASNALTIVNSHLRVLRRLCSDPAALEALDSVESALTHSESVIGRVSDWSDRKDTLEHVDLANIVQTVMQWIAPTVPRGVHLQVSSSLKDGAKTLCHRHDLLEALLNIVKNAIEALKDGGNIWIELSQNTTNKAILIDIRDDGPGVSPELENVLFEPFLSSKGTSGSGLGLASSRHLLLRSGITLSYLKAKPSGSIFRLEFRPAAKPISSVDLSQPLKIAVIDNEIAIAELLSDYLGEQGYTAEKFCHASELLEADTGFDLYVCDLDLNDMSGWDVLNLLRRAGKTAPFILMSGWKIGWDLDALQSRGVAGFLKKPFQLRDVANVLAQIHQRP